MATYTSPLIRLRSAVLVFLTHSLALPILKLIRKEEKFPYLMDELDRMPVGTLGKDLHDFLEERDLDLLPYYARHDMKHILLGYDTTDVGEGCLQFFMLGNGHRSFPVLATVGFCLLTMPGHWHMFRQAWRRGKESAPISGWDWFMLVGEKTTDLRAEINQSTYQIQRL